MEGALTALGRILTSGRLAYELVTVGGGRLLLLGLIQRPTRDLDVVAVKEGGHYVKVAQLPPPLRQAVLEVGAIFQIGPNWINAGPADLFDFGLPPGFEKRTEVRHYGALTLHIASRADQVPLELYAGVDQGPRSKHFQDLRQLAPSRDELVAGARWALTHDPSPGFRRELIAALASLGVADGDTLI